MEEYLRTYCEIDLKAIRENYINIKKKTGDNAMTMAVIKADGYGHGAVEVAHYLNDIADYFGVATIDEGVELRKAGLKQPILLLGYNSPSLSLITNSLLIIGKLPITSMQTYFSLNAIYK